MTCSKKTHTQRHGTLVVHTCIIERHDCAGFGTLVNSARSLSFQLITWKMSTPGWVRDQGDHDVVCHAKTNLSHYSLPSQPWDFCVSWVGRTGMKLFKIIQKTLVGLWARPPVLLPVLRQASHSSFSPFVDTSTHPCCCQHVQQLQKTAPQQKQNAQLRSSAPSTPAWLSICAVSSKLLTHSAPSPLS